MMNRFQTLLSILMCAATSWQNASAAPLHWSYKSCNGSATAAAADATTATSVDDEVCKW
jgi:hypothetical protein